jgi:hypothetical protein
MRIGDAMICWTPNRPEYPSGMRGKARIFESTAGADEMTPFPCRAGRTDPRAHDPRLEARQTWSLQIAFVMHERDGLSVATVHKLMLGIDEYASGCAEDLPNDPTKEFER